MNKIIQKISTIIIMLIVLACNKNFDNEEFSLTDIDGNNYMAVKIGEQIWMAENLKVTHYRNGDPILSGVKNSEWEKLSTGAFSVYDNNLLHNDKFGYLYNWYTVEDSRGLAPEGWHIPSDNEWQILEIEIGMHEYDAVSVGWRGEDEGGKLKEVGTDNWKSPNEGATNETEFRALPGGYRAGDGNYFKINYYCEFWTNTEGSSDSISFYAWKRKITNDSTTIYRNTAVKPAGFSIRCVKD